ncbi:MAG: cytochrome b/b6 domain-containing protein [Candidatus Aminicenantes bacterium]|nr:cytochrome b/b6 domain-containing protein [Candidatus Aminicenantes bacterium]
MKTCHISTAVIFILILIAIAGLVMGSDKPAAPNTGAGEPTIPGLSQVMHPQISLLDKEGKVIKDKTGIISMERTCGQCHDFQYINKHNNHITPLVKADCTVCHFKEGRVGEDYSAVHLRIQLPADENCAQCHGLVQSGADPLFIPGDYEENLVYKEGKKYYDITQHTGVILGGQNLANSALNLKNKKELHFPWDVHSRRQMNCISCHFIGNDPRFYGNIPPSLDHLLIDPRKVKSPGEILKRPDHNLKFTSCTSCHNPLKVHKNLPYKKRHMEVLSCESCHVPEIYGPALQAIDRTVVKVDGSPRIEYRGVDESKSHGPSISTRYFVGFRPFLFPHLYQPRTLSTNSNEKPPLPQYKISPFNLVTYWYWKSGTTGEPAPDSLVQKTYRGDSPDGFAEDIVKAFDANKNRVVDAAELVLDSQEKVQLIRGKLKALGVAEPAIVGEIQAYKINHGVMEFMHMKRDCSGCHAPVGVGKFGQEATLSIAGPIGVTPGFSRDLLPIIEGNIAMDSRGQVILKRNASSSSSASLAGYYVFGHNRTPWLDRLGFWIFLLALLGIIVHGIFRYLSSLKHAPQRPAAKQVYMYRFYERLWHWTMAAGIILLALTGLEIHYTGSFAFFGLEYAVAIHNTLAAILVINAFLALFYHLTTGEIRQFFGFNRYFVKEAAAQAFYYVNGIFKGAPHPIPKSVERKLNPLQQVIYIGLLNILLPFQVITGLLMWGAGQTNLAPVHHLGSWLFLSFLAVHIYLTTTGHTLFSNVRAMITGYDEVVEENNERTKPNH